MDVSELQSHSVVLGTTSKWRRELFEKHFRGIPYSYDAADIDEGAAGGDRENVDPSVLTTAIAHAKADALLDKYKGQTAVLLTLDQVVVVDGVIREKPSSADEARAFLRSYAVHPVATVTAIVATECVNGRRIAAVDKASLKLKPLTDEVIESLVKKGDVMYSAGGVTVEDELVLPFHGELNGELESILGLPVSTTWRLLKEATNMPKC